MNKQVIKRGSSTLAKPHMRTLKMHELVQPLEIGFGKSLSTRIRIKLIDPDGTVVLEEEREGHSLLYGFIYLLYTQFARINDDNEAYTDATPLGGRMPTAGWLKLGYDDPNSGSYDDDTIVAASIATTCRITFNTTSLGSTKMEMVKIRGATGMTELNGEWYVNWIDSDESDLYYDKAKTLPLDTSGAAALSNTPRVSYCTTMRNRLSNAYSSVSNFDDAQLSIGRGNAVVQFYDWTLEDSVREGTGTGEVEHTGTTIAAPVIDSGNDTGQITFGRLFANNSGGAIAMEELGLWCNFQNGDSSDTGERFLIARDLYSVTIGIGQTIDVQWEFTIDSDPVSGNGGWLRQYIELMFRSFAYSTSRDVKTWENVSHNVASNTLQMTVTAPGGLLQDTQPATGSGTDHKQYLIGPLFGLGDTETLAVGSVTLDTGASGSVDGITVNGVEIMAGGVNFDTSLTITANQVALNITLNDTFPNYTAINTGAKIDITAALGSGAGANGFVVVSSVTTITSTDVNMASGVTAVIPTVTIDDFSLADGATDKLIHHGKKSSQLIHYGSLVDPIKQLGIVSLDSGSAGQIDSVSIDGVTVTSGAVSYNTSLAQTAIDLASDINGYSSNPQYKAEAIGTKVYVYKTSPINIIHRDDDYSTLAPGSGGLTVTTKEGAWFDCYRIFENQSGSQVTAFDAGLFCAFDADDPEFVYCMARHPISGGFDVPDTECAKLIYRILIAA